MEELSAYYGGGIYVPTAASANLFRSKKHPTKTFWQCTADTAKIFQKAGKLMTQAALSPGLLVTVPTVGLPVGTTKAIVHHRKKARKAKSSASFKLKPEFSAGLCKKKTLSGMWKPMNNVKHQFLAAAKKASTSKKGTLTMRFWANELGHLTRKANITSGSVNDRIEKMNKFMMFDKTTSGFQSLEAKPEDAKSFLKQMDRYADQTKRMIESTMERHQIVLKHLASAPAPMKKAAQQFSHAYEALINETLHRADQIDSAYRFAEDGTRTLAEKETIARNFMARFALPES